jgi:hypothetical protein
MSPWRPQGLDRESAKRGMQRLPQRRVQRVVARRGRNGRSARREAEHECASRHARPSAQPSRRGDGSRKPQRRDEPPRPRDHQTDGDAEAQRPGREQSDDAHAMRRARRAHGEGRGACTVSLGVPRWT